MPHQPLYVPILKGKEGEFAALEALDAETRRLLTPLIEVPPVPYDFANERPAKSLGEHIAAIPERLKRCCPSGAVYLDFNWIQEDDRLLNGRTAFESVLKGSLEAGVDVIPVVSLQSPSEHLNVLQANASRSYQPVCIRLVVEDFEGDADIDVETERLLSRIGREAGSVDLILDLEDLGADLGRAKLVARSIFQMLTRKDWRRLVLAAASFPEDLSDVNAATTRTLPRLEWELWKALQRRPKSLPHPDLIFGDYAISHPLPKEIDPRTMRMSANIRYTTDDYWLIVKGRNVRQYGFSQYFELCEELVKRPEYSGRDFSWGDGYIADCAVRRTGPGNATTWRKVGVNHHLTLVAQQIANFAPAI